MSENHYIKLFCNLLTSPVNSMCKSKIQLLGIWGVHIDICFKKSNLRQITVISKTSSPQDQKAQRRLIKFSDTILLFFPKVSSNRISLKIKMGLLGSETLTIIKHEAILILI